MPAKGTTIAQTELRINRIARLLANGATRSECVQYAATEWGLKPRQVDNYIQRAREILRADWEIDRKTFVAELLSQLATLQKEARKSNQPHVALGCINTAARIARVFE
jgi:DNA-directed RNA polymerase sigma subunit (sigma70/sigma32)